MLRRLLLFTLLLVMSGGTAFAEWVYVISSRANGGYAVYANPDTIRRKGSLVKIWALLDFKSAQTVAGSSYLSFKKQNEYDCADELERMLASTGYSENMGGGEALFTDSDPGKWSPVAPDSVGHALWKLVYSKP